jgi:guanylate kinase
VTARGIPFVISAPSGTGKTTVCHELIRRDPHLVFSVSHTTRAPREGEVDGRHYHFLSRQSFEAMVVADKFLEHAEYSGHLYGTAWPALDIHLAAGRDVLLEIETIGAAQVRERDVGAFLIFLLPPSLESLAARLRGRGTDRAGEVARRLRIAQNEFRAARHFDAVVINRAVEDTVTTVMEIVAAVREGAAAQVAVERSLEQLRAQLPPPLDEWVQP